MSHSFNVVSPSSTNGHALTTESIAYHPTSADFSALPGLTSLAQSLKAQPQHAASTANEQEPLQNKTSPVHSCGNADIAKLERLKKEILEGQNPLYKAVPQPSFLESLYLGRSTRAQSSVPAHPDQIDSHPPQATSQALSEAPPEANEAMSEADGSEWSIVEKKSEVEGIKGINVQHDENDDRASAHEADSKPSPPDPSSPHTSAVVQGQDTVKSPFGVDTPISISKRDSPPQSVVHPTSEKTPVQPSPGTLHVSPVAPSKLALPEDPPYDPKESLGLLEGLRSSSVWLDERNKHPTGSYTPIGSVSPYTLPPDNKGNYEPNDEWNRRYQYSEGGHVLDSYHDRYPYTVPAVATGLFHSSEVEGTDGSFFRENHSSDGLPPDHPVNVFKPVERAARDLAPSVSSIPVGGGYAPHGMGHQAFPAIDSSDRSVDLDNLRDIAHGSGEASNIERPEYLKSQTIGKVPLEERIGDRAASVSGPRNSNRMALEKRITSPPGERYSHSKPALQERIEDRRSLEERISSGQLNDKPSNVGTDDPSTPLSLIRPRPVGNGVSPPVSTSQGMQTKSEEQPLRIPFSNDYRPTIPLTSRSAQGNGMHSPSRGKPFDASRLPSNDGSDTMLIPSPGYRGDRERHSMDDGGPDRYERPMLRERDSGAIEDRTRPSLENREWRERGTYSRKFVPRSEAHHPPAGSSPRVWTANPRNGRPSESPADDGGRYHEREYDRRPVPPNTWEREDIGRTRPAPEVYPPPPGLGNIDRDPYPPTSSLRERLLVRGRSPSPNPVRRSTYGEPPPAKRFRDEMYYDDRTSRYTAHFDGQPASPPPLPPDNYYGPPRSRYVPRDVHNAYIARNPYYDRRPVDIGPPPTPPYAGRPTYSRPDLDRYNPVPPRTI